MKGKVSKFILLIAILLLLLLQLIPSGVVANNKWVNVNLNFTNDQVQFADVTPSIGDQVVFNGSLNVYMNSFGPAFPVKIELFASTDLGWDCTVIPSKFSILPGASQPFTVEVNVPANISYYYYSLISISCKYSSFPDYVTYSRPPITGSIRARQYQNYTVGCEDPVLQGKPGSEEWFEIYVKNTGNARDKIYFEIDNLDELEKKSFSVMLIQNKIEFPTYTNNSVRFRVTVPKSAEAIGDHEIVLKTYLMSGDGEIILIKNLTLQLEVPEENIIYTNEFFISSIILIVIIFCIFFVWQSRKLRKKRNIKLKKP
jgi:hypothetical protein